MPYPSFSARLIWEVADSLIPPNDSLANSPSYRIPRQPLRRGRFARKNDYAYTFVITILDSFVTHHPSVHINLTTDSLTSHPQRTEPRFTGRSEWVASAEPRVVGLASGGRIQTLTYHDSCIRYSAVTETIRYL